MSHGISNIIAISSQFLPELAAKGPMRKDRMVHTIGSAVIEEGLVESGGWGGTFLGEKVDVLRRKAVPAESLFLIAFKAFI